MAAVTGDRAPHAPDAMARGLSRAASARDGRLALLSLPEPGRRLHAVALTGRPRPVVDPAGRGLRGGERHVALGGTADRAAHTELVRRRYGSAGGQRGGQRDPGRRRHVGRLRVPTARSLGRARRRRGRRTGRRERGEHHDHPRLSGARAARDHRRSQRTPRVAPDRLHRRRGLRAGGVGRHRGVPVGPPPSGGGPPDRRGPPATSRQARNERHRRPAAASSATVCATRSARVGPSRSAASSASPRSTTSVSSAVSPPSAPGRTRRSSCSPTRAPVS